jgi:cytoskeletal protein RodZ
MSSTPFGEHLKRERELRGVSLEEVSAATRISTRFLEAMEADQWDRLPGGVFNRGFVRSIARFLGLDEDNLVAEYALGTATATEVRSDPERGAMIPRNWKAVWIAIALLAIIMAAAFACYHYRGWIANHLHRHIAVPSSSTGSVGPAGQPSP